MESKQIRKTVAKRGKTNPRELPCHRQYNQSEHRKGITSTFPSCAARLSHLLCYPPYILWHGIKRLCNAFSWHTMEYPTCHLYFLCIHIRLSPKGLCVYRETTRDSWDIPWYTTRKRCITSKQQLVLTRLLIGREMSVFVLIDYNAQEDFLLINYSRILGR